ncbi:TolC family protein [Mucilaginibacter gotjawali]|uniref:Outer membrane efflux protein n=2 Tax=Mucilaginibacter gotjawali TaxID=1550579 RepID=A0A0X8X2V2_9SPHI|nr:TolC family protein [Mucilaginibacter gotjawali]MBB3055769.1 outer membrane protein TolC [Mucilaginibacter gotjawali]BAU54590.1 Outer membrane efflux protein [Mucilaginibacter gotjawali]
MFIIKRCLFMWLWLVIAITTYAQQPSPLTLKELLSKVDQKAPALLTDSAAILIRLAQANEVHNNWLPNLKLNYQADIGTSNNTTGPYFGFGIIPSSSGGIHNTSVTTALSDNLGIAALDWEVYNFGKYGAQNRVANSDVTVEQNQYAESKYDLRAFTIGNYLQLLRLQDFMGIQYRDIQRTQEILRSIMSLAKSGVRPGVDTSIAQAELSKARLNYIEVNNQLKQVQLQLSAVSGYPYQSIVPDTTIEMTLIGQPSAYLFPADTANHPLINFYRSVYQNNLDREKLIKKMYNPAISVEAAAWDRGSSVDANGQYNNLSSGYGFQRGNYLVGVGISYNLFDLRRRQLKLRTQKASTDYAYKKLQEQQQLLNISASQADVEMETALNRLKEIPNQLKAANDGYRQKLSLYRNGLTDIVELDAALNILYRAETDYMQAKYDYSNALFRKAITENQVNSILNLLK